MTKHILQVRRKNLKLGLYPMDGHYYTCNALKPKLDDEIQFWLETAPDTWMCGWTLVFGRDFSFTTAIKVGETIQVRLPEAGATDGSKAVPHAVGRNSVQLGETLRRLRQRAGLTQKAVAVALGFSMPSVIAAVEAGAAPVEVRHWKKLARLYDVSLTRMALLMQTMGTDEDEERA